jgi:hypothetical protein
MRRLDSVVHALVFALALVGWCALLAPPEKKPSVPIVRPDAFESSKIEQPHRVDTVEHETPTHASDVVVEEYPLRDVDLAVLSPGEHIVLPHPDGGTIDLVVERVESLADRRHLSLTYDGLPSTFTETRGEFFGTVATRSGVYALEGNGQRSQLTRHALLDQRTNAHALDYRSLPSL